jgi:hypothetical protein
MTKKLKTVGMRNKNHERGFIGKHRGWCSLLFWTPARIKRWMEGSDNYELKAKL